MRGSQVPDSLSEAKEPTAGVGPGRSQEESPAHRLAFAPLQLTARMLPNGQRPPYRVSLPSQKTET